jgi:hypothetical protein
VGVTSTVLDGVLCLLLISAAVVTVTTATPQEPAGEGRAANVAATLATTTTSINHTLAPWNGTTGVAVPTRDGALDRTAHGTLAHLLARAVVARATVGESRLSYAREGYGRAVVEAVRGAVRTNHTRITAVWRPYPGSSIGGRITVGGRPPPDRPVHAATVVASSGFPETEAAARSAAESRGVDGVADVVAERFVRGQFPPTRTRIAAGGGSPESALVRHRYRRLAGLLDASRSRRPTLADGGVADDNDRLERAVAERVRRDLRVSNTSAASAAEGVRLGRVRIVVRTWP